MIRRRSTRLASIQSTAASLSKADIVIPVAQGAEESDSSLSPMDEDSDVVVVPKKTKRRTKSQAKKRKGSQLNTDEAEEDGGQEASASPRKKRAPKPEPVYVIPDVEKRMTTFQGRLGYACLNTILRNKKPAADAVFCSRTCR